MAKRPNRLPPIQHEQWQIDNLKRLEPNATPLRYRALSDGLIEVATVALDIVAALESSAKPDFERLYDLVDALPDLLDTESDDDTVDDPEHSTATAQTTPLPDIVAQDTRSSATVNRAGQSGVTTMKTNIIGRPDRVEVNDDTVILYLTYTPKPNANGTFSMPKGVPAPQAVSTSVVAYVGKKQFDKVKAQLDNPDDALIVEGGMSQVVDGVLIVYASNITSKLLQQAKTEQKKADQSA